MGIHKTLCSEPRFLRIACFAFILLIHFSVQLKAQQSLDASKRPRYIEVTARAIPFLQDGAIICASKDDVDLMINLIDAYKSALHDDAVTNGQNGLIHGKPVPPNLKSYGCTLIPPGTPMILDTQSIVPVVTVKLKNGTSIKGVTEFTMYIRTQAASSINHDMPSPIHTPTMNTPETTPQPTPIPAKIEQAHFGSLVGVTPNPNFASAPISTPDKDGVYNIGGDISGLKIISSVDPEFTDDARRAKIKGVVLVGLVVDAQGNPKNIHVVRGVGYGLDQKAIEAVQQYKFKPAIKQGEGPVPVRLSINVNFQIY